MVHLLVCAAELWILAKKIPGDPCHGSHAAYVEHLCQRDSVQGKTLVSYRMHTSTKGITLTRFCPGGRLKLTRAFQRTCKRTGFAQWHAHDGKQQIMDPGTNRSKNDHPSPNSAKLLHCNPCQAAVEPKQSCQSQ
eukprot:3126486-Amphidinium_carterae.1